MPADRFGYSWSGVNLRVKVPGRASEESIHVGRQSSNDACELFRERVLQNSDFKPGSRDINGLKGTGVKGGPNPGVSASQSPS